MSDDGFRVGRRVFSADHGDGVIKTYVGVNDGGTNLWGVVFANTPSGYTHPCRQADLQLLPDESATPEPQPAEGSKPDMVNTPPHYTQGGIECIDAIEAALTPEEFRGFLKGNVIKYAWRERHKGGVESLRKAGWYLRRLTGEAS